MPILSVNANSWTTLRGYLEDCKAMVVFAQELKLQGEAVQEASAKALKMGWRCLLTAADPGPKVGASGGVGIFVRGEVGLRSWTSAKSMGCAGSRLLAAIVDVPGLGSVLGLVTYMFTGVGTGRPNVQLLGKAGEAIQHWGGPAIFGWRLQHEPPAAQRHRVPDQASAQGSDSFPWQANMQVCGYIQ